MQPVLRLSQRSDLTSRFSRTNVQLPPPADTQSVRFLVLASEAVETGKEAPKPEVGFAPVFGRLRGMTNVSFRAKRPRRSFEPSRTFAKVDKEDGILLLIDVRNVP